MSNLSLMGSKTTPAVLFFIEKGILKISGRSLPEDAIEFYDKIENALDKFIKKYSDVALEIECNFDYLDTSSCKLFFDLMKKATVSLKNVTIIWDYEEDDKDMRILGEEFANALGVKFEYKVFASF